jgi:type I restriction enzyme S subunit
VGAKCGNIHLVKESAWITDNALILKPSCAVSIGYLAYSLDSLHLNQFSSQNAQPLITGTQVKEALIAIPSLEEQRLIHLSLSNYLSKIDILISKKQRLIELLKEKRAAIISRAVTKGLDPNAPMKDSGVEWIGEIPEGWDVAKLKRVVNHVGRGISPKYAEKSSIAVINQACVYWEGISKDYLKYHEETDISELRKGLLKKGDLLLNSTGTGTLGRALLFNLDRVCIADSHVTIVRCNRKLMIPSFLRLVVETSLYQSKILNELVAGSTNQIELSREKLRNLIVVLPHIEEQERIVAYATERNHKLDSFISKIEKSIELLKEYRSALITAAVTGKIDVREEVP